MPTNNFKLFDQNKANLLSDTEYANATQRLNGVQTGVASSQLNNKFAYQVSLVAYAIAQIMNQNGLDASDTLSVSAFVGNLGGALLQKVADKASSAEAVAGVLENKYISPATMKAAALLLSGGVMTGTLDMNNNQIINLPTPTSNSEPATKGYVDGNKVQKYQVITIPATVSEGKQIFKFDGISDFKYIQIYFDGAYSNSINYLHMYVGGTTTEIFADLYWRDLQTWIIYGFVNGSNILFNGFGGSSNDRYFRNLSSVSIPKSTILSKGIEWDYTTDSGSDKSYLFHMVF